jgi:hypothetical protein
MNEEERVIPTQRKSGRRMATDEYKYLSRQTAIAFLGPQLEHIQTTVLCGEPPWIQMGKVLVSFCRHAEQ